MARTLYINRDENGAISQVFSRPQEEGQETILETDSEYQRYVLDPDSKLKDIRDEKALNFAYKGIVMKLADGARADISAVYFSVVLDTNIPDETVMMVWQESGYDPLPITAGDLRSDGALFMQHRQACFTAATQVDTSGIDTEEDLEAAFDAAYNAIIGA